MIRQWLLERFETGENPWDVCQAARRRFPFAKVWWSYTRAVWRTHHGGLPLASLDEH